MKESFRSLLTSRRAGAEKIQEEQASGEAWYTKSFEGIESYQQRFSEVLQGQTVEGLLRELRGGREVIALDFMGYGVPLTQCGVAHGLATALTDVRPDELREQQNNKVSFLPGDIFSKALWKEMDDWLSQQQEHSFDVILAAPNGGVLAIPKDPNVYYWLMDQLWRRVSRNGGVILVEFSTTQYEMVERWKKEVEKADITIRIARAKPGAGKSIASTLYVRRTEESPEHLPALSQL